MASRRVRLTFPADLVTEPIIYLIGRNFDVVTNIRRANIVRDAGWVILEISGENPEIDRAIQYMEERGVTVEPVEGDVVAS